MNFASTLALLALALPAAAQYDAVRRLDLTPSGGPSNGFVTKPVVSPDGEFVVFRSTATDLLAGPPVVAIPSQPPGTERVLYRMDVREREFVQVNLGSAGQALRLAESVIVSADRVAMSADGNLIVWTALDDDPGLGDANGENDVYLRDVAAGTTELISGVASGSTVGRSGYPSISADGRYVAFISSSDDLVPGLSGGSTSLQEMSKRVFLRDRQTGTTTLISEFNGGIAFDESAYDAHVTADGSKVVYSEVAGPLVFGTSSGQPAEVHVVDLASATRASFGPYTSAIWLVTSDDGGRVGFVTFSALDPDDQLNTRDAYVLDTATGAHLAVSRSTLGAFGTGSVTRLAISGDGRYAQFETDSAGFFSGAPKGDEQLLVKDLDTGLMVFGSVANDGQPGTSFSDLDGLYSGSGATLDADGDVLVFASNYDSLPGNNEGGNASLYLYERRFADRDLRIENLHAGQTATIRATGMTPGALVMVGVSLTGQGPLPSYWGPLDLGGTIYLLGGTADGTGILELTNPIAPSMTGTPVFAKALDMTANLPSTSYFGRIR